MNDIVMIWAMLCFITFSTLVKRYLDTLPQGLVFLIMHLHSIIKMNRNYGHFEISLVGMDNVERKLKRKRLRE